MTLARQLRRAARAGAVFCVVALAACGSGGGGTAGGEARADPVKIYYLQKQATQGYFLGEAAGAKKRAQELGINLVLLDLGNDTSTTMSAVKTAVSGKADGIIIVVPDPAVGPAVVAAAKAAGIPLLTSDDQVCVSQPDPADCPATALVPRVGFSGTQMGGQAGKKAAELYLRAGWKPAETRIIAAWKQDVTVCTDRVKAALPAFKLAAGVDISVIEVGTDNTPSTAQSKIATTVAANRSVKNWIVWGCNDENVTGGTSALDAAGYKPTNVIGIGINGDLACKMWAAGKAAGVKATLWLNGGEVGALAVQSMYDKIKDGRELKPESFAKPTIVTPETYKAAGLTC